MSIKWLVFDMDGTLLDDNNQIESKLKEALMECQKAGIKLILASGRSYLRLMKYVDLLGMVENKGFLIEVNGMAITPLESGKRKILKRLTRDDYTQIFEYIKNLDIEIQFNTDDGIYLYLSEKVYAFKEKIREAKQLPADYPWTGGAWDWFDDLRDGYPKGGMIQNLECLPETLNKMTILQGSDEIDEIFPLFYSEFDGKYEINRTCPRIIEINPKGINKGNALQQLMSDHGIKSDEVIVFGDGENDVEMFKQVKYSVAMGNSADYVKKFAFETTTDNINNGILNIIRKYNLISE